MQNDYRDYSDSGDYVFDELASGEGLSWVHEP